MKKSLFLYVSFAGWENFEYENLSELSEEFAKRGIVVSDTANIGNHANIGDEAVIKRTLFITGSRHAVNYYGQDLIHIGCKRKTIKEWQETYERVGESKEYDTEQIEEYAGYINLIANLHNIANVGN